MHVSKHEKNLMVEVPDGFVVTYILIYIRTACVLVTLVLVISFEVSAKVFLKVNLSMKKQAISFRLFSYIYIFNSGFLRTFAIILNASKTITFEVESRVLISTVIYTFYLSLALMATEKYKQIIVHLLSKIKLTKRNRTIPYGISNI